MDGRGKRKVPWVRRIGIDVDSALVVGTAVDLVVHSLIVYKKHADFSRKIRQEKNI